MMTHETSHIHVEHTPGEGMGYVATFIAIIVLIALTLGGCAKAPPPPVVIAAPAAKPYMPAECDERSDPRWQQLPDADVKRSDGARAWRTNRGRYGDIQRKRRVCGKALRAGRGE